MDNAIFGKTSAQIVIAFMFKLMVTNYFFIQAKCVVSEY